MFKRHIAMIIAITSFINPILIIADEMHATKNINFHVSQTYLNSIFGEEQSTETPPVDPNSLSFLDKIKQQYEAERQTLTAREVQSIAFDLVIAQNPKVTSIIDESCIDKLEIVTSNGNQQGLISTIFKDIYTTTGKAHAVISLCNPTTDTALLNSRQQAISFISKNEPLTSLITKSMKTIACSENKSLQSWHTKDPVKSNLLKSFYFGSWIKSLNTETLPLELYNKGLSSFSLAWGIIGVPAIKVFINSLAYKTNLASAAKITLQRITSPRIPLKIKFLENFDLAFQSIYAYQSTMSLKSTGEIANHLQDGLIATSSHIKELKKLGSMITNNPELLIYIPSLQPLADFNNAAKHSDKLNKLLGMLETNTFKGQASFWSITGRILAAYELMKQVKDELAPVFAAAGELDMYVALAQLYNNHENKDARYCMVNFIENSTTPVIDAQGFWNPFINADTVVINDILFNTSCPNSILTGPNTGGKSTVIKAIMLDVLMAQTFGIAPAQSLSITPFAKLNCFMNISDDIATGASLFKSEVMRAKKLLDIVQSLQQDEFSFVIIDEVFTGTSPKEGEAAAMQFSKKLGSYKNNIGIIATHYPKMTELETQDASDYRNHHIEILRNEDGSLNRTFKLKNGPSFLNVASDILEEEGLFV